MSAAPPSAPGPAPRLDAPFAPRRGRTIPLGVAGVLLVLCAVVAVLMVTRGPWHVGDGLMLLGLGGSIAAFLVRYAMIRATPGPDGLRVRNLLLSRTVAWGEIGHVLFPEGDPWVSLDLTDGDVLAVMAIQRVDGSRSRTEAQRLADLVATRQAGLAGLGGAEA